MFDVQAGSLRTESFTLPQFGTSPDLLTNFIHDMASTPGANFVPLGPGSTPEFFVFSDFPTWNFTVAHLHGTPQVLGEEENLAVLTRLVEHFERRVPDPAYLEREYAIPIAKGTLGLRIPIDRFELKRKLSQNKDEETRRNVIAALREEGPYRHLELAEEMEREL